MEGQSGGRVEAEAAEEEAEEEDGSGWRVWEERSKLGGIEDAGLALDGW